MRQKLGTKGRIIYNDNRQPPFFLCFIVTTSLPSYTYATGRSEDQNIHYTFSASKIWIFMFLNGPEQQLWKQIFGSNYLFCVSICKHSYKFNIDTNIQVAYF
jgi:hypothetical protein